ncbi:hypothetical protein [Vibrio phage phiKT1024]|nr:hypothetical protein [Vibrio phage phiKT1024]
MSQELEAQVEECVESVEHLEGEGGSETNVLPGDSQIVNIFGKQYLAESVTQRAHSIVKDIGLINEEIERIEKSLRVAQLAKGALLQNYHDESKYFTEIEVQVLKK